MRRIVKRMKAGKLLRLLILASVALCAATLPFASADAAQVAMTVEKLTVDGGFIFEPELVALSDSDTAGSLATRYLTSKLPGVARPYESSGTGSFFYITGIHDSATGGLLSEFGHGAGSGWMITVNNIFIGRSPGIYALHDGDVVRWQYTKSLGSDIGGNADSLGANKKADKDALVKKVAEINKAGDKLSYGGAYITAVSALKKINATQSELDAALAALNGDTSGGGNSETTPGGTTPGGTTPGDTTPGSTTPDDTTPGGTTPGDTTPDNGGSSTPDSEVVAEILEEPPFTPPSGIEAGSKTRKADMSDMKALGLDGYMAANGDGAVTVSGTAFASGIEATGIKVDAGTVTYLPGVSKKVTQGRTAVFTTRLRLDAYAGKKLSSVSVFKMKADGTVGKLATAPSVGQMTAGSFIWTDTAGNVIQPSDEAQSGRDYSLSVAVGDDSEYDLDRTNPGTVLDPPVLAVESAVSGPTGEDEKDGETGGGGGCDSGASGVLALSLVALLSVTARRRGR